MTKYAFTLCDEGGVVLGETHDSVYTAVLECRKWSVLNERHRCFAYQVVKVEGYTHTTDPIILVMAGHMYMLANSDEVWELLNIIEKEV
jgi:hypothetical protein